ncbi:DUF4142 domain-containing protein [Streptomyces sp. NPDC088387]|uniref:DUF4142 domain-containing protein n=1 Tax=Streptomyces sp. NPDC088387 TaxID=3365859 RepID=UPI003830A83C
MRPRPPVQGRGILNGTTLVIACLAVTLAALLVPLWMYAKTPDAGADTLSAQTLSTRYGPLSALDQRLLTELRKAGQWEPEAGLQAQQKGTTDAVHQAGLRLAESETTLNGRVSDVLTRLGLELPAESTRPRQAVRSALDRARGTAYDRAFSNTLRQEQGRLYQLIAQVRVDTANSLMRELAEDAGPVLLDQIKALEATGYVDYGALGQDPAPAPDTGATAGPGDTVPLPATPSYGDPMPPATSSPRPPQGSS